MLSERNQDIFSKIILVMLMSSSICQTLYTSLFMTKTLSLTIFLVIIPITLMFFVIFKNSISSIISGIVISGILILLLIKVLYSSESQATNSLSGFYDYSFWFVSIIDGFIDTTKIAYIYITEVSLAFIITLLIYLLYVKFYNFYVVSLMLFSIFFVQLYLNIFISNLSFIIFFFTFMLYYFFDIFYKRCKDKSFDKGSNLKYLVYTIPICIIVIVISLTFSVNENRASIPWLDKKFDSVINYFTGTDIADFDYFSIKSTGFGSRNRLGGNIELNNTHVMNVKSEYTNLYLKASSKAFYDSKNWYDENLQTDSLGSRMYTLTIDPISSLNKEFSQEVNAEIEYVNLKTMSLFIPPKLFSISFRKYCSLFEDNEQMLSLSEAKSKSFNYSVKYNLIKLNSDAFKSAIRKSHKGYYMDNFDSYKSNVYTNLEQGIKMSIKDDAKDSKRLITNKAGKPVSAKTESTDKLKTEVQNILNSIYSRYTQLPDSITQRVRDLAKKITEKETTDYDKAKAIEAYLSTNYPYTLRPGNVPRKADFVDYFLFEGKKGYCTYYASAMTVLLRCINIPTRYIEGYILPPDNKNGVFKVTNQQAHAWVEVYFEGFGWIPFEPTSPFAANMYYDRKMSASISGNMIDSGYEAYLEMLNRYRDSENSINYKYEAIDTNTETKPNTSYLVTTIVLSVFGIIILAFCSLLTKNILFRFSKLRKIRKGDPNTAVLMAYTYILSILSFLNIKPYAGETPCEFGTRVEKSLDFKAFSYEKTSFTEITNHYISARYSKALLQNAEQKAMLDFIKVLFNFTYVKIGKLKYFVYRFILGKF